MADGIKFNGYLLQSDHILKKYAKNRKECNKQVDFMLESAGENVLENSGRVASHGFRSVVQFVHRLFEVAAAATNAFSAEGEDDTKDIKALNEHAMAGLKMIGGEQIEYDFDSSDDEDEDDV
jgi:hypothetical protein